MEDYEKITVVGRGAHGVCRLCRRKDDVFGQKVIVKTISLDGLTPEEETAIMGIFYFSPYGCDGTCRLPGRQVEVNYKRHLSRFN